MGEVKGKKGTLKAVKLRQILVSNLDLGIFVRNDQTSRQLGVSLLVPFFPKSQLGPEQQNGIGIHANDVFRPVQSLTCS